MLDCREERGWSQALGRTQNFGWGWLDCRDMTTGMISRRHATLAYDAASKMFTVTDNGSTGGTFVNGIRLTANTATQLRSGYRISLLGAIPAGPPRTCKLNAGNFAFRFERPHTAPLVDASQRVSGRHAVLRYARQSDTFSIEDTGSTNGVFSNGLKVRSRCLSIAFRLATQVPKRPRYPQSRDSMGSTLLPGKRDLT